MTDVRALLADALNDHDYDSFVDDNDDGSITEGVYCLKCGWKGATQKDATDHLVDVLLSLPGIAIVELPESAGEDVDDEDRPKLKGDYLKRADSSSEVWVEGLPGSAPYVFFGRRYRGPSYMPAEYARDVAAALLAAANAAEQATNDQQEAQR